MMNLTDYDSIPEATFAAMQRYAEQHVPTGSFLEAVISNNLQEAVLRGDRHNLEVLPAITYWFYMESPSRCHGSSEHYNNWIKESACK